MIRDGRLALANLWVAVGAFGVAAMIALMQALSRSNLELPFRSARIYYLSVTAHGVLMALVFTTFFIMAFGYAVAGRALGRECPDRRLAWGSFWVALGGTLAATAAILSGRASVLYTFYPPLKAHPAFYIGATLLVIGSWGWCLVMIRWFRAWRREHAQAPIPLAMHGMLTTIIVWLLATPGVAAEMLFQLIPWSLGLKDTVDPVLARTLFWWFGHPLVYFWLLPAYVIWYTVLPKAVGGKLFSDPLARLVFVLFIVLSTPVGLHHQMLDPGVSAGWKLFHSFNTLWILFPSFITAFTVIASLELAARARAPGAGLLGWVRHLPWSDPLAASVMLAMLLFAIGGFGGAINASFGMNAVVHNTSWIPGHFHTTVGSASALTFMGAAYWLLPKLSGRDLELRPLAKLQPWLWFLGMLLFSIPTHLTGIMGMPRRVFDASYGGSAAAQQWRLPTYISSVGGFVLFVSAMFFVMVMLATVLAGRKAEQAPLDFAEPLEAGAPPRLLDRLVLWTVVAAVLIVMAYAWPLYHLISMPGPGSPPFTPF